MRQRRVFALVPAAGKSIRMGRPKLALPLGGRTVLERVIDAFRAAGVPHVLVVLPPRGEGLADAAAKAGAEVFLLDEETPDMRATVQRGLDRMEALWQPWKDDAWLLSPADHPTLDPQVVRQLLAAWREHPEASLFIPTCEGKRGHPALAAWSHVEAIRAFPADQGLNVYFRSRTDVTREVPIASTAILSDLDTPQDYERLLREIESEPGA